MTLKNFFTANKFLLACIFFTVYILTNLIGGDRGVIQYFEKKKILSELKLKEKKLISELQEIEKKNKLLSEKLNFDYLDLIYRQKLNFGKKDEIIIRFKN